MTAQPIPFPRKRSIQEFSEFFPSLIVGPPKPREWMIDATIMRKTVCLLTGAPGIGKSLVLQQALTAAALGKPWLAKQVEPCAAFGLFAEDDQDELERRQLAINEHYEVEPPDLELKLSWRARQNGDSRLMNFEKFSDLPVFTMLWGQLWDHVSEFGCQLIGLDTAAVVFGGNENFRGQATAFMTELAEKADEINGSIILNAHPSKQNANTYSGSTAWLASCRVALSMGRPKEFNEDTGQPALERVLRQLKANYSGGGAPEKLRWDRGVFVADEPDPTSRPLSQIDKMDLDYRLLAGLKKVLSNGGLVPADPLAPGSMPRRARAGSVDLSLMPLNALYDAQDRLIERGQLLRVQVNRRCLIRPADGFKYPGESSWEFGK